MTTATKMIQGLYETHLGVTDLGVSVRFYRDILGLTPCHTDDKRRAAFFWIGEPRQAMLGLWEVKAKDADKRHFAFQCSLEFILNNAADYLMSKGIVPYNFLNDGTRRPMVFAWMPALSIYFTDPDGHELEFISILHGDPRPDAGVISYEAWLELSE